MMNRRKFIQFGVVSSALTLANAQQSNNSPTYNSFTTKLIIPKILEPDSLANGLKHYTLTVQEGKKRFFKNRETFTYGINGNYLGPTLRVKNKETLKMLVNNQLKEETVIHWHGLKIPGIHDGGPSRAILPKQSWNTSLSVNQRASMCWYHPHSHKTTGRQVYMGLAGLILIDDEESLSLNLPNNYGLDDIPLVLQDRRFDSEGQFVYKQSMHDTMMGVTGDIQLINGVIDPLLNVDAKVVRLRILNGANARIYSLAFNNELTFYQIAGDSSLLPNSVALKSLILSPGERAEILVDLSNMQGQELYLGDKLNNKALLKIKVNDKVRNMGIIPEQLTTVNEYNNALPLNKREFTINMNMMFLGINNKKMNLNRIDEEVSLGVTELWRIKNPQRHAHPFHIHGCSFKILTRNGKAPYSNELGLKDTVLLYSNEVLEILVKFEHKASKKYPYMYHCHILEHEDAGMMGQFTVV